MGSKLIDMMVSAVEEGYTPRSVVETSLVFGPGARAKVNKATTAKDYHTGAAVTIPEGTVVTVIGVGGGDTGNDHHVMLPNGNQAVVPFYDLGESMLQQEHVDEMMLTSGVVKKITLSKPLPQSAIEWLEAGYMDFDVELPAVPDKDDDKSVVFMMKGEDEVMLDAAIGDLKTAAGTSFKSVAPASLGDW